MSQINEEASDKVLEVEQKYNEIRKPVYDKRNEIIKAIPDFWLTAVSCPFSSFAFGKEIWVFFSSFFLKLRLFNKEFVS